jgi:metal transporter CNNM
MTYITVILLLIFSGLLSGLNLGLMSLEPNELKRKAKLGDVGAAKVYTIRRKGNQLLVTLILSNVAVNVSLAIILDSIAAGVVAVIVATLLITLFGEVIPQSVFSRFALPFGARMAFFVKYLMIILSPICKPIAWVLDKGLGEELPMVYSRKELIEILEEHGSSQSSDIKRDEEKIASGALSFGSRLVKDVMTPRSVVVTLTASHVITHHTIATLVKHGYSRFPVSTSPNPKQLVSSH